MNELELIQLLHNYNESEQFYYEYQEAKKNEEGFRKFIASLNVAECEKALHYSRAA